MKGPTITLWIIIATAAILTLWDVYAEAVLGNSSTISVVLTSWAHAYPIIPFAFGLLMGHLFASQHPNSQNSDDKKHE